MRLSPPEDVFVAVADDFVCDDDVACGVAVCVALAGLSAGGGVPFARVVAVGWARWEFSADRVADSRVGEGVGVTDGVLTVAVGEGVGLGVAVSVGDGLGLGVTDGVGDATGVSAGIIRSTREPGPARSEGARI